jgi:CheY-like chemotaxis protein
MILSRNHKHADTVGLKSAIKPEDCRILLVEDDEGNGSQIREYLNSLGYMTDWCCNGIDALKYAKQYIYDLFLVDAHMPRMGGIEFIKTIRSHNMYTRTPVILMTGSIYNKSEEIFSDNHIQRFIYKPFSLDDLVPLINRVLFAFQAE